MGQKIQHAGIAVPVVRLVEHSKECVIDGAKKLLAERVVKVRKCVKDERCRVMGIPDGRCFGDGCDGRDDRHCAGIEGGG